MNKNKLQFIHATALRNFVHYIGATDDRLEDYIKETREKFMEYQNLKISEALPLITAGLDEKSLIIGAIIMGYTCDFVFQKFGDKS